MASDLAEKGRGQNMSKSSENLPKCVGIVEVANLAIVDLCGLKGGEKRTACMV